MSHQGTNYREYGASQMEKRIATQQATKHVVVSGDPIQGIEVVGPFDDREDAIKYAETNMRGESWWTTEMTAP